jgi:hypothetical protein
MASRRFVRHRLAKAVFYTYLDDLQAWLAQKMRTAVPGSLALPIPAGD